MKSKTLRQFSFRFVSAMLVITANLICVTGADTTPAPAPDSQLVQFFDELQQFIAGIPDTTLNQGQRNSLFKKIENARAALLRGQPCTAANILQAFINEANALRRGVSLIVANDLYNRGLLLQSDVLEAVPQQEGCPGSEQSYQCASTPWAELAALSLVANPAQPAPGGGATITFAMLNRGGKGAANVPVVFRSDGTLFAQESVAVVPCGRVEMTVWWPGGDQGPHVLEAQIDPFGTIVEGTRTNNTARLQLFVVFEAVRPWERPDIVVDSLSITPRRALSGNAVSLQVPVRNDGNEEMVDVKLRFLVDGEVIEEKNLPLLPAHGQLSVTGTWQNAAAGRHELAAQAELPPGKYERDTTNNTASMVVHIGGEEAPLPDLVVEDFLVATQSAHRLTAAIRNIGWADVTGLPVAVAVDGELMETSILNIGQDSSAPISVSLGTLPEGQHIVQVMIDPENLKLKTDAPGTFSQVVPVYTKASLCRSGGWTSIGPAILSTGSVGRVDRVVVDPDDTNTIYVAAPTGGIHKSINGGASWAPLTDYSASLHTSAMIMDPTDSTILYAGTEAGLFKTIDGGENWSTFTDTTIGKNFRTLILHYTNSSQTNFVLYAGSDKGVWRYDGTDKSLTKAASSSWKQIRSGIVLDLIQHPSDDTRFYVAIYSANGDRTRVYRSKAGGIPTGDASWDELTNGLTGLPSDPVDVRLAISQSNPSVLYAGLGTRKMPGIDPVPAYYRLYRTSDGGDNWQLKGLYVRELAWFGYWENWYNAYVVVHPQQPNTVFVGHIQAYRSDDGGSTLKRITGVHDDQHGFAFHPGSPQSIYLTGDGGIFKCATSSSGTVCSSLNTGLAVTMFYDVALSNSDTDFIIGGTQDNGTIRYTGSSQFLWDEIRGNDGRYVAINPSNEAIVFSQEQYLDSTGKAANGTATHPDWRKAPGLNPTDHPYYIIDPYDANVLLAAGTEVFRNTSAQTDWTKCPSCGSWSGIGPTGSSVKGSVRRVAVSSDPLTNSYLYLAGMTSGQIWASGDGGATWGSSPIFTHPTGRAVSSIAVDPQDANRLFVSFEGAGDPLNHVWMIERLVGGGPDISDYFYYVYWKKTNITGNLPTNLALGTGWFQSNMLAVHPTASNTVFVATDKGVYRGQGTYANAKWSWNWQAYNCGLPWGLVSDLEIRQESGWYYLYAATYGRGLFKSKIGTLPEIQ